MYCCGSTPAHVKACTNLKAQKYSASSSVEVLLCRNFLTFDSQDSPYQKPLNLPMCVSAVYTVDNET